MLSRKNLSSLKEKRIEEFEKQREELRSQNWSSRELGFGAAADFLSLGAALLPALAVFFSYYKLYGSFCPLSYGLNIFNILLFLILCSIILSLAYELIRGLAWGIFAPEHFKAVSFEFDIKRFTFRSLCRLPLKKGPYVAGLIIPVIITAAVPALLALSTGSLLFLFISLLGFLSGGDDLVLALRLLCQRAAKESLYAAQPIKRGSLIFEKNEKAE